MATAELVTASEKIGERRRGSSSKVPTEADPRKTLFHGTPHRDGTLLGETMEILGCRSTQLLFSQA
jgi:hypothetical protein